jgi:H/ACA ribonucleoprotein complex non-core subunit NAF1
MAQIDPVSSRKLTISTRLKVETTTVSVASEQAPAQDTLNSHHDSSSSSSDSSSDSDDFDSDDDDKDSIAAIRNKLREAENDNGDEDDDDDGEGGPGSSKNAYAQTKNEIPDVPINIPDIEEVSNHEQLEHVGEIMAIINNVVIVKGDVRSSDRVLDTDTLLVFEDHKVFGYVRVQLSRSIFLAND